MPVVVFMSQALRIDNVKHLDEKLNYKSINVTEEIFLARF